MILVNDGESQLEAIERLSRTLSVNLIIGDTGPVNNALLYELIAALAAETIRLQKELETQATVLLRHKADRGSHR